MALLGLVGLLHRGCARSSPSGLGATVLDPREARKRAWRSRAHGRVDVLAIMGRAGRGCQTRSHARRAGPSARVPAITRPSGWPRSGAPGRRSGHARIPPGSIGRIAPERLASLLRPVLSFAGPRRREASVASPGRPPGEPPERTAAGPQSAPNEPDRHGSPSPRPWPTHYPSPPSKPQVRPDRWTRSKSGVPPSASCRSRSRRRTSRPGFARPSWSTSTTTASGSRSRTASPRTGSTPATAP